MPLIQKLENGYNGVKTQISNVKNVVVDKASQSFGKLQDAWEQGRTSFEQARKNFQNGFNNLHGNNRQLVADGIPFNVIDDGDDVLRMANSGGSVGKKASEAGENLSGKNWNFDPKKDLDLRGTDSTYRDALDEAFERTGIPREEFEVTKWGKDANGKSIPVEYQGPGGANVNIDIPEWNNVKTNGALGEGPHQPHIGYQTPGKKTDRVRGHIFVDKVPTTRR